MRTRVTSLLLILAIVALAQAPNAMAQAKPGLTLSTTSFDDGGIIRDKYTAVVTGTPVSPPLTWTNVPDGTASFALLVHDPDTSVRKTVTEILHWMFYNISGNRARTPRGSSGGGATS